MEIQNLLKEEILAKQFTKIRVHCINIFRLDESIYKYKRPTYIRHIK